MSLRAEKREATARRIRKVAGELFLRDGYEQTSVEEIAAAAQVSRASLFNYYRGKQAILLAMSAELEPRLMQLLDHYLEKPGSTVERLRALFSYSERVLSQTAELTRLMFVHGSGGRGYPALRDEFVRLVRQGQRQGDVRKDLSPESLGDAAYLGFVAALLGWDAPGVDAPGVDAPGVNPGAASLEQRLGFLEAALAVVPPGETA